MHTRVEWFASPHPRALLGAELDPDHGNWVVIFISIIEALIACLLYHTRRTITLETDADVSRGTLGLSGHQLG